jgi:hypothetical protein
MEIIVTKSGRHPFAVGQHFEVWGGVWIDEETGSVVTPDGTIPPGSWEEFKPDPDDNTTV